MNQRDDLKAYLDGELAPERMAEMREAIDRDPVLAQEAEELGQISQTLRAAASQPASIGLEATLRALEKAERRERKPWWPWLVPVAGMTAILAFVVAPTMQQAKMAAKSDSSVAFHRNAESAAAMSAPIAEEEASEKSGSRSAIAYANGTAKDSADLLSKAAKKTEGRSERETRVPEVPTRSETGALSTAESSKARRSEPSKPTAPAVQNARLGDLKGQRVPSTSDFGNTRNIAVEPKEQGKGKTQESSVFNVQVARAKAPVETIVIEVDSIADADDAAQELVARLGAEDTPALMRKAEKDSAMAFDAAIRDQIKVERRVVLEVDEDQLGETKKRVSETIKETQARREAQQARMRGGTGGLGGAGGGAPSGGGFGGAGGFGQSQQGETNSQQGGRQQQNPPGPSQRTGVQSVSGQGGMQGFQSRPPAPRDNAQASTPNGKKTNIATTNKQFAPKPRKRIEIILRVKPKPAGKLEE